MRLVFSTDQIYLHGGIEKVMAQKANYFADVLEYEVIILTTEQKQNAPCYALSPNIQLIDLNINYERGKSFVHPANLAKVPLHFFRWVKTMFRLRPQILIVCNYAFDFYWIPFLFHKCAKLKEFHSSRYYSQHHRAKAKGFTLVGYQIQSAVERRYTKLVVLNQSETAFYSSKQQVVIPNPVESSDFNAPLHTKKVIAAGRLAPVKGFDNLLEIWAKVIQHEPDWTLSIYGQGEPQYVAYLQSKIHQLNLKNQVFIREAVPHLTQTMQDYSMYVMTSHTECYPMVLLEALAIGLPCVAYNCPTGPAYIISPDQDGYLVSDQNKEAFVEKVLFLIRNPEIRYQMGAMAKQNAKRFSTEKVMQHWQAVFENYTL